MDKFFDWIGYNSDLDRKNRLAYVITGFSIFMVLLFLTFFIVLVKHFYVILGTVFCLLLLVISLFLLKRGLFTRGKFLLILGFLLQECALVFLWFPVEANFNYFFFIVTPMTFFIFDFQIPREKLGIVVSNVVVVILLLGSEVLPLNERVVVLNSQLIRLFAGLSVFSTAGSIAVVFYQYGYILNQTYRNLNILAETDSLTQIHNRRTLFSQGKAVFDISKKTRNSFSFILFDIDHFKRVNDQYGHPEGDLVLIQLCQLVQKNIRHNDIFARYGGEEFALIIKDTEADDISTVAEALRKLVEKTPFILSDEKEIPLCISLGVVTYSERYSSFDEIVTMADKALYQAKRDGRNQVAFLE